MKETKNISIKDQLKSLKKYVTIFERYRLIVFIVLSVAVYGYLVMQISNAAQTEPTQTQIDEKSTAVKKLRIDQNSVTKIQQLQDQNVVVQSLFEDARNNPFQEE